jgi:hypothetical protein
MERIRQELADSQVRDVDGRPRRLDDLWKDRTCVLVFVRQFG